MESPSSRESRFSGTDRVAPRLIYVKDVIKIMLKKITYLTFEMFNPATALRMRVMAARFQQKS